jgi:hypothetical protein
LAKKGGIPTDSGPWINSWVQTGKVGFGDPNIPPYMVALLTGANEYAKIIAGATGAQGSTVDSRREAAEMFKSAYNYDQIKKAIDAAKNDMENKKQSYRDMASDIKDRIAGVRSGKKMPQPGESEGGYKYIGPPGDNEEDRANPNNWEQE